MHRRPLARLVDLALVAAAVVLQAAPPASIEDAHDHHKHMEIPDAAMIPAAATLLSAGWTATASSEEADTDASRVLDGDRTTIWHSRWRTASSLPQWLTIDMKVARRVSGLVYTPRAPQRNGRIGRYEIRLSQDGTAWGDPVVTGTTADDEAVKTISFATATARFVRLVALSEAGERGPWASAAEIDVLGDPGPAPPTQGDPSVAGTWGPAVGFPLVPAASAVLPGNKLLTWSAYAT
ncbi:MAG TPA: discoidin domain-containing protein, partial [Lentzea sp.]